MRLMKTDKEVLNKEDILAFISEYEHKVVPTLNLLWDYYEGENVKILSRKPVDANNPDNKIPVPYGRKIITTFTGYGYRPKYITYKAEVEQDQSLEMESDASDQTIQLNKTPEELYVDQLLQTFKKNNEPIKTARAGRNTGIFGRAYELVYIDREVDAKDGQLTVNATPKFFTVDPREIILLYDYSSEPQKKIGIRYYKMSENKYTVEVYYKTKIEVYARERNDASNEWQLAFINDYVNYFDAIPIVPYYFDDEMIGILKPVIALIDAFDTLYSDSMNEFDRFAFAYLIMKKFGLTDPTKMKDPNTFSKALKNMKKSRIIEHLPSDAEISFLTKDIPTPFIEFMTAKVREQIHIQSHVPDFTSDKMAGASGIAIQRLLFDFENVVSMAEADFDLGLYERIRLITTIYEKAKLQTGEPTDIVITHKRNLPLNLKEYADTALVLKNAGFSSYLIADTMPDDIVPDIQSELLRQKKEADELLEANDPYANGDGLENTDEENTDEIV